MPNRDDTLPIPNDWDGETWEIATLCVPDSTLWRAMVRGMIWKLGRGRNWNGDTGNIKDTQEVGVQILESLNMQCNETFERIALALENLSITTTSTAGACCAGEQTGTPPSDVPPSPVEQGQGTPPVSPDWPAFLLRKCKGARLMHDQVRQVLIEIAQYGGIGVGLTGGLLAGILALIVTPWAVAVGLLVLVAGLLADNVLDTLRMEWDDMLEDFVCALFEGLDANQSQGNALNAVAEGISNSVSVQFISALMTFNFINKLYNESFSDEELEGYSDDCSACVPPGLEVVSSAGTISGDPTLIGTPFTITSQARGGGFDYQTARIRYNMNVQMDIVSVTGWVSPQPDPDAKSNIQDTIPPDQVVLYNDWGVPAGSIFCANNWSMSGHPDDVFTVEYQIITSGCTNG